MPLGVDGDPGGPRELLRTLDPDLRPVVIRHSLLSEGHTATAVHDGSAALDATRRLRPDLVVLDLMPPVIDGFGGCRVLRRDDDIPVLMLMARSAPSGRVQSRGLVHGRRLSYGSRGRGAGPRRPCG